MPLGVPHRPLLVAASLEQQPQQPMVQPLGGSNTVENMGLAGSLEITLPRLEAAPEMPFAASGLSVPREGGRQNRFAALQSLAVDESDGTLSESPRISPRLLCKRDLPRRLSADNLGEMAITRQELVEAHAEVSQRWASFLAADGGAHGEDRGETNFASESHNNGARRRGRPRKGGRRKQVRSVAQNSYSLRSYVKPA